MPTLDHNLRLGGSERGSSEKILAISEVTSAGKFLASRSGMLLVEALVCMLLLDVAAGAVAQPCRRSTRIMPSVYALIAAACALIGRRG